MAAFSLCFHCSRTDSWRVLFHTGLSKMLM